GEAGEGALGWFVVAGGSACQYLVASSGSRSKKDISAVSPLSFLLLFLFDLEPQEDGLFVQVGLGQPHYNHEEAVALRLFAGVERHASRVALNLTPRGTGPNIGVEACVQDLAQPRPALASPILQLCHNFAV